VSFIVVKKGDEPLIKDAMDWLASKGLPARLIGSVDLHAEVGDVMWLSVKLLVDVTPDMPEALREQASLLLTRANEIEGKADTPDLDQIKADIREHLGPGWEPVQ
jgi:hypothetical protein